MQIVINVSEELYKDIQERSTEIQAEGYVLENAVLNGTQLSKGHGRIVDISKIDEDRIDDDNPVIYLTINGEYIEAVSLDYLNGLPTIIEADRSEEK